MRRHLALTALLALPGCALVPVAGTQIAPATSAASGAANSIFTDIESFKQQFVLGELANAHNLIYQAGLIIGATGMVAPTSGIGTMAPVMMPTPSPTSPMPVTTPSQPGSPVTTPSPVINPTS